MCRELDRVAVSGVRQEGPRARPSRMARADLRHDGLQPRLQLDREGFPQGMPRKVSERIVSGLWSFIGKLVDSFRPQERTNYLYWFLRL